MTSIHGEARIHASKEKVWAAIADLGAVQNFHPGVSKSYYTSEQHEGPGASRHCDLRPTGSVEERVTEWRAGEEITLEIYDGDKMPPFETAFGRMSVRTEGQDTLVGFSLEYRLKFGPLGTLIDRLMVRPRFEKMVPKVLAGLKRYSETAAVAAS